MDLSSGGTVGGTSVAPPWSGTSVRLTGSQCRRAARRTPAAPGRVKDSAVRPRRSARTRLGPTPAQDAPVVTVNSFE
ncbi:hypothetical protein ABZX40_29275 [Streptomyces sp. NPDC004610]|uniref:hypothetical protein n=1 Tax=unclassified Streptomyces TaxID=2593676 RepID=UPI0033A39869